jgi:hypothetical protein
VKKTWGVTQVEALNSKPRTAKNQKTKNTCWNPAYICTLRLLMLSGTFWCLAHSKLLKKYSVGYCFYRGGGENYALARRHIKSLVNSKGHMLTIVLTYWLQTWLGCSCVFKEEAKCANAKKKKFWSLLFSRRSWISLVISPGAKKAASIIMSLTEFHPAQDNFS